MSDVLTKQQLIDALRTSGEKVTATLAGTSDADLERGRYENGWNGREIVAHVASIESTYPRLIEMASGARAAPAASASSRPAPTGPRQPGMASGAPQILSYNDRQVEKRAGVPVPELIAEFKKNRAATIAASRPSTTRFWRRK